MTPSQTDVPSSTTGLLNTPHVSATDDRSRRGWRLAGPIVFLAAVFAYVLVVIDPRLLYHAYITELPIRETRIVFPEFFLGGGFLQDFLLLPGGLTEYLGAFLGQLFYFPVVGSLILTCVAAGVMWMTAGLARRFNWEHAKMFACVPVLVLMVIWNRYTFHLADQLALLMALGWARLYVDIQRPVLRGLSLILGAGVIYYLIGGPLVLVLVMCGLFELLIKRNKILAGLNFVFVVALPLVASTLLANLGFIEAVARLVGPLPLEYPAEKLTGNWERFLAAGLYGYLLLLASEPIWSSEQDVDEEEPEDTPSSPSALKRILCAVVVVLLFVGLGGAAMVASYDRQAGRLLRINYYAKTQQWEALLACAERCPPEDFHVASIRQVNRALFETGQMGDRAFAFPQPPRGLLPDVSLEELTLGPEYSLLALGAVNQAEHLAAESLAVRGPTPHTLRVSAIAFITKGETDAARVFLCYLSRDIIHGPWAREQLTKLDADPLMSDDPEIQRFRSAMLSEKTIHLNRGIPTLLRHAETGTNRMAFEYLMTHYLIRRELDEAVALLETGRHFYEELPVHYGEAVILQSRARGSVSELDPDIDDISPQARKRAERFIQLLDTYRSDPGALAEVLANEMTDSYYRYYRTGQSGKLK
jgi:hypothetical protein